MHTSRASARFLWAAIAIVGAVCLGVVALRRGEPINAIWVVTAAIAVFLIAYRFYGRFIATKVLALDPTRATPAVLRNDGLDYVPTDTRVVFGHHFAAIAGAGPLVGPVLAAQMGYLPGTLWILVGVVFGALSNAVGMTLRSREAIIGVYTFFMLPLMFLSSAFMQTYLMPGWMQAIASRNPLNWVVQIGRTALSAHPDWAGIGVRCGGLLLLAVACVAVSVATFRSYQKNV